MAAVLKQPEIEEDLSQLESAELLKLLYGETRSAKAQALYQELMSRQALEDMKKSMSQSRWAETQKNGPAQVKTNAEQMRDKWRRRAIHRLLAGYLTREQIINELEDFSRGRYRGKCGDIKASTIEKWLTKAQEISIRLEVDRERLQGVTAANYEE